jgi:ArsR family transcriptional regulator
MMPSLEHARDLLHLFGDSTRVRLVALLARHPLTVAELTAVTELPQSRVSTHLGRLREAGILRDRANGTSTVYAVDEDAMPEPARRMWGLLRETLEDAVLEADAERADALLRARERADAWPYAVAGQMERHYSPGRTWEAAARAFLGLARLGDVLDGGSGDGTIAALLAPRARSITCLDRSERMLRAARARLARWPHVRCALGDLERIPAAAASFDEVLLLNVLTSVRAPARAVAESARVLRPGGHLVLVTLDAHGHFDLTARYGHVHPGFTPATLRGWLRRAGLAVDTCEVAAREKREPHFNVITAFARRPTETP